MQPTPDPTIAHPTSRLLTTGGRRLAAATALALVLAACGGDDDPAPASASGAATSPADAPAPAADEPADDADAGAVVVTAVDYGFEVPSLAAGDEVTLTNASAEELHELVAFKLADDDDRSAEELLEAMSADGPPPGEFAGVVVAPPMSDGFAPEGPLVLEEGRYLFLCAIPTGADPQAYLAAAQESEGGPVDVPGGPPHFVQGMVQAVDVGA